MLYTESADHTSINLFGQLTVKWNHQCCVDNKGEKGKNRTTFLLCSDLELRALKPFLFPTLNLFPWTVISCVNICQSKNKMCLSGYTSHVINEAETSNYFSFSLAGVHGLPQHTSLRPKADMNVIICT